MIHLAVAFAVLAHVLFWGAGLAMLAVIQKLVIAALIKKNMAPFAIKNAANILPVSARYVGANAQAVFLIVAAEFA